MGTPAFPDLGKHCSDPSCRQLDFLPFTCDACTKVFCLDHRSYTAHKCPKSSSKDRTVMICPFCAKSVANVAGEDPNLTLDRHLRVACDPNNYEKVMNKPKCAVKKCKEVLSPSNKYNCKVCKKTVCMKHRFELDHECKKQQGPKQPDFASKFMQALSLRTGSECGSSSSTSNSKRSNKWPKMFWE